MAFRDGSGRLCLDFVRTLHRRDGVPVEELPDGPALAAWVRRFGPVAPPEAGGAQAVIVPAVIVVGAQDLRGAVRQLVDAVALHPGNGGVPRAALDTVNTAAGRSVPVPSLGADGTLRWLAADPVTATLALVARDALDLVTSPAAARVRACADPGCAALFLDGSRTGTRRWCSMDCGYRARRRQRTVPARQPLS